METLSHASSIQAIKRSICIGKTLIYIKGYFFSLIFIKLNRVFITLYLYGQGITGYTKA